MNRSLLLFFVLALAPASVQAQGHQHPGGLDSGDIRPGGTWETHLGNGLFTYHCHPHPFMEGRIEVREDAPEGPVEVRIRDYEFVPASIQVRPEQTIRFINDGPSTHTVTEGAGTTPTSEAGSSPAPATGVVLAVLVGALASRRRP